MRVAVIGAGIVGVTTAFELAADGHAVTVFERRGSVAEETSFANAGVVAPGYVTPWAAPGMPLKVLGMMFSRHAAGCDRASIARPGLAVALVARLPARHLAPPTVRACRAGALQPHRLHELTSPATRATNRPGLPGAAAQPQELASAPVPA
jgi:choline dehydrogenase-like flavoprotein